MKTNVPSASKSTGLTAGSSSDTSTSDLDESTAGSNRLLLAVRYLWGDEGITTQLIEVVRYLRAHGWEVGLVWGVAPEESEKNENLSWLADHTETFYVPFPEYQLSAQSVADVFRAAYKLSHTVLYFKPSIIHIHSFSIFALFYLLRIVIRLPIVITPHSEPDTRRFSVKFFSFINNFFRVCFCDYIIAVSSKIKTVYTKKLKVKETATRLIHHGVDTSHFRPPTPSERIASRRMFGLSNRCRVVCLVGRLDPVKGHRVLFAALKQLRAQGIRIEAICAGEGGFTKQIKECAEQMGIRDQVIFPGFCDARTVFWASDISVCPSFSEAFALVVVEAMLSGLVPIRTPAGGYSDQICEGINGFVVPFNDSRALAERMGELFDDEERRERMANAAREFAKERFGLEQSLGRLLTFYQDIQRPAFD